MAYIRKTPEDIWNDIYIPTTGEIKGRESPGNRLIQIYDSTNNAIRVSLGTGSGSLPTRVSALEDGYIYDTYYKEITSTNVTGTLTAATELATGARFVSDYWPEGIDAIISSLASVYPAAGGTFNYPDWQEAFDASGNSITTDFTLCGSPSGSLATYSFSGTPSDNTVAIIYRYRITRQYFDGDKSLDETQLDNVEIVEATAEPSNAPPGLVWIVKP